MRSHARAEFEAFEHNFRAAVDAAGGAVVHRFVLAGVRIELHLAGPGLVASLLPALRHHVEGFDEAPDLIIQAWDSRSTGVALDAGVGPLERHRERGMPSVPPEDGVYAAFLRPDPGLSMLDCTAGRAVYWIPDAFNTPFEDRSGAFRGILNWWMSLHGLQFIHAAAVGTASGAVLVVGPSGSGKSTTALACMLAGLRYLGDDYCILETGDRPRVHSLYLSAKLNADHLERFPDLEACVVNRARLPIEKGVLDVGMVEGVAVARSAPIRAVLVPVVTGECHTTIVPLPKPAALAALAPSTVLQLASARQEAMRRMADLVRSVPAYQLRAGTRLDEIPKAVARLLESLEHDGADA